MVALCMIKLRAVNTIIPTVTIWVSPIRDIFLDLSAISARTGCKKTATTLPTARITPISELEYPLPKRNADAKLPIMAYVIQYVAWTAPYSIFNIFLI